MGLDLELDKPEDLGPLVDTLGPLRREGLLAAGADHRQLAACRGGSDYARSVDRSTWLALPDSVIDAIRKRFGMGWWGVSLRLYGREGVKSRGARGARKGDERR